MILYRVGFINRDNGRCDSIYLHAINTKREDRFLAASCISAELLSSMEECIAKAIQAAEISVISYLEIPYTAGANKPNYTDWMWLE